MNPKQRIEQAITEAVDECYQSAMVTVNTLRNEYHAPEKADEVLLVTANGMLQKLKQRLDSRPGYSPADLFVLSLVDKYAQEAEYTIYEGGISLDFALLEELLETLQQRINERKSLNSQKIKESTDE